jgi:2-polyprenyl-3-methyl-5-hydroxy-6-metoxy-1,4-benzoquinol methylase
MDTLKKNEKFWDKTASYYDKVEKNDISYLIFIEKARKHMKAPDVVLDFGCGTGLLCNEIADDVNTIHAIDISSKMIEISMAKTVGLKIQNIEYAHTTIFDERLMPGSFDAIIAFNVFHLLEELPKYFQRINELLKPGGFIISATPCMGEKPLLNSLFKIGSKIGIMPKIKSFKNSDLGQLFLNENFEIIENDCLKPNSPQYCLIAKKI